MTDCPRESRPTCKMQNIPYVSNKFGHGGMFYVATIQHQALLTCNNNTPDLSYSVLCLTHLKLSGKPHGPRSYNLQTRITLEYIYLYGRRDNCIVSPALCLIRRFSNLFSMCDEGYSIAFTQFYPST